MHTVMNRQDRQFVVSFERELVLWYILQVTYTRHIMVIICIHIQVLVIVIGSVVHIYVCINLN